jgi:3-hydroxyisobutyrate dehydrogenase-like beta-hydroxyacid dehydrogenase
LETIGFIGLGKMGIAMATRLLETGVPLTVWNRSSEKADTLVAQGAKLAPSVSDLVESASLIITMLGNDTVTREIYTGTDGILSGTISGKLFIDMSTLRPSTVSSLAEELLAKDACFIDAPVSGTVGPAEQGQLMVLCGANNEDLERARPVLDILSRRIVHAGPTGLGSLLKLVVNLPLAVYWESLAEAASLGTSGGLSLELILETIQDSSAALAVLPLKTPYLLGQAGTVAFDVTGMQKDLNSMLQTGLAHNLPMPVTKGALSMYEAAVDAGLGNDDAVKIVHYLLDQANSTHNRKENLN